MRGEQKRKPDKKLAAAIDRAITNSGVTAASIADRLNISEQAVSAWRRRGQISRANLVKLSKMLGVDLYSQNVAPGPAFRSELPLISWVQAGELMEIEDPYAVGDFERLIQFTRQFSEKAFCLRVQGDSMVRPSPDGPSFPAGTIIAVEPTQAAHNGSLVVARLEKSKEATFKELVLDGDRAYLKPLNPRYPILELDTETRIIGVVRQAVIDLE